MVHYNVGNKHLRKQQMGVLGFWYDKILHPDGLRAKLDKAIYPISLIGPVMMIPQVWKIYANQDASNIAAFSWVFFMLTSATWILYGVVHRERVIVICNVAWLTAYTLMVVGASLY